MLNKKRCDIIFWITNLSCRNLPRLVGCHPPPYHHPPWFAQLIGKSIHNKPSPSRSTPAATSFPGSSLYLKVERGPWERGCSVILVPYVSRYHLGRISSILQQLLHSAQLTDLESPRRSVARLCKSGRPTQALVAFVVYASKPRPLRGPPEWRSALC